MRTFWALPLRRQLFVAILLLLVPVVVAAVWSGLTTFNERKEELAEQAQIIAATTAAYIDRDIGEFDRLSQRLATDPVVRALDPEASLALFRRAVVDRPAVLRVALASADGTLITALDRTAEPLANGAWPQNVLTLGKRAVAEMYGEHAGSNGYIVLGHPVGGEDGDPIGTIGVFITLTSLGNAFRSLPLNDETVVRVASLDGIVLARSQEPERFVGRRDAQGARTAPRAPYEASGLDTVWRQYAEARADVGPWIVAAGIPTSIAMDRAASLWSRIFAILGLGLLGWLVVAVVLSRRLGDAVSHLEATAQRIAAGDFSPMKRKVMFSREFHELQGAFDSMLRRFNTTRQMLDAQMAEERRIRTELESLQGQVIRQERLAAVGQLVSGVAHEINNPLQAILGFAELLQMQGDVPDSVKSDLKLIQKESARACGIIRNLALFARQQPGPAAPVRLRDVITSVVELRQRRLESEDIHLQVDDRSTQHVMAVLTELQQVVLNFVVNAEQAILASGRLPGRITLRTYDVSGRVTLEAEDTGPGVSPEDEAKLFQPFFTTKPVGQGTGLGLSISYGIIDSLGGQIGYRRPATGGSIFYFTLPAE